MMPKRLYLVRQHIWEQHLGNLRNLLMLLQRYGSRGWQDKVFAGFTNSASLNGDKQVTLIQLQTLASQHGGIWVSLGLFQPIPKLQNVKM
jgi:multimeric flavodoxin WrbA